MHRVILDVCPDRADPRSMTLGASALNAIVLNRILPGLISTSV
jgi:hypothetical protein